MSSYERADRETTVASLVELAGFYGVPPAGLLPHASAIHPAPPPSTLVLDLQRVAELPSDQAGPLARYAAALHAQRGDHNGKILTIRNQDLRFLAIIYGTNPQELLDQLTHWKVPQAAPNSINLQTIIEHAANSDCQRQQTTGSSRLH